MSEEKQEGMEQAEDVMERVQEHMEALRKEWHGQPLGFDEILANTVFWGAILTNIYPEAAEAAQYLISVTKVSGSKLGPGQSRGVTWN